MRILVIEDEPKTAEYLHQGLTESGYIVDRAVTGADGLHLARQHVYDLVILDVNLPELDGWGVLEHLRQSSRSGARSRAPPCLSWRAAYRFDDQGVRASASTDASDWRGTLTNPNHLLSVGYEF